MFLWFFMTLTIWTDSITSTFIFALINQLIVRLFWELSVDFPFFQRIFFQKVADYPFFVGVIFHNVHNHVYIHGRSHLSLRILNRKIKHFVNLLFICKPIKLWPLWNAFWEHNPNQKSHGSTYLINLMAHVQSFEVLSTKCV